MLRVAITTVAIGLSAASTHAAEWWHGDFAWEESTLPCENNDSRVSYSATEVRRWEQSCFMKKVTPLKGLDGVILDMSCFGEGDDLGPKKELLLKLDDGKIAAFPDLHVLQVCSKITAAMPAEKVQPTPDANCGDKPALFRAGLVGNPDTASYQELEFRYQSSASEATITQYSKGKAVWVSHGQYRCSNGAVICYLEFPLMNDGKPTSMAIEVVEGVKGPTVVIPTFSQFVYTVERYSVDHGGKAYGGLVADLLAGYAPGDDELLTPFNAYTFVGCKGLMLPYE